MSCKAKLKKILLMSNNEAGPAAELHFLGDFDVSVIPLRGNLKDIKILNYHCVLLDLRSTRPKDIDLKQFISAVKGKPIIILADDNRCNHFLGTLKMGVSDVIGKSDFLTINQSFFINKVIENNKTVNRIKREGLKAKTNLFNKNKYISVMAHEIKNPISAITGAATLIDSGTLDKDSRDQCIDILARSAKNLGLLLDDLLDLSVLEMGKASLKLSDEPIKKILEDIIFGHTHLASQKDLQLSCSFSDDVPDILRIDQGKLSQVVINLVNNAIKYTESGWIKVNVSMINNKETVQISIEDSGIGMTEKELKHIFRMYERTETAKNSRIRGAGVGLAICKNLIQAMNGNIFVSSVYNGGSKFTLQLPAVTGNHLASKNIEDLQNLGVNRIQNVLAIDDESLNGLILEKTLAQLGYNVDLAHDGDNALKLCKMNSYDLIAVDYFLPGVTGPEISKQIRKIPHNMKSIIFCLSASIDDERRKSCIDAGMNFVLEKPLRIEDLKSILAVEKNQKDNKAA